MSDNVTSIGEGAFMFCSSLTDIVLSDGLTNISDAEFFLSGLMSITIPDGVISIGNSAFAGCSDLTSVTIPTSVTSIDDSAFDDCGSLQDVYYAGSEEDWEQISIGSYNTDLTDAAIYYNHPQHSYTDEVTTEPTYEAEGVRTYTCTICGESYTETIDQLPPVSLLRTKITLSKLSVVYTGKAQKPSVTIKIGKVTVPDSQYTVSYSNNTNVGIAKVTIKAAKGATYVSGIVSQLFIITKAANPLTVSPSEKTLKASDCKKKAQTLTIDVKKAEGMVSYKSSNSKYITVSKGKVTVKKGTPKGTYKITVTAMGSKNYKSGSKTVTITVK
jgi:hypothetical protein